MKAVPQPQLRPRPAENLPPLALIHFRGGEAEWLKLNSDLPKLIECRTVGDLEQGFIQRLYRLMDFLFVLVHQQQDWRIIAAYLHFCDANGSFLPERTVDQNGRIKREGKGLWSGLRGSSNQTKKENTDLVGRYLTRKPRESADETIATYLGMTQEEKEKELRRILVSMDLILEVAEKRKCWRAAVMYLKMVDYDGSFLPMTSAARDRWEKTYARHVDKWEQLEKRRADPPLPPLDKGGRNGVPNSPLSTGGHGCEALSPQPLSHGERGGNRPFPPGYGGARGGEVCSPHPLGEGLGERAKKTQGLPTPNPSEEGSETGASPLLGGVGGGSATSPLGTGGPGRVDAHQAHQDKLNAAIPGRLHRGKKKHKPAALTPRPSSATYNAKGQVVAKGKVPDQKPKACPPQTVTTQKPEPSKRIGNQPDMNPVSTRSGKDPP
jgi:hypothetical protein